MGQRHEGRRSARAGLAVRQSSLVADVQRWLDVRCVLAAGMMRHASAAQTGWWQPGIHLGARRRVAVRHNALGRVRVSGVLAHVTGQVRLLRVGLAADAADVGLDVLRLRMLGDVLAEALLVGEALVARVTSIWLVGHVRAGVRLEVGQLREGLPASRMLTLVRLFSGVRTDVLLKVAELGESSLADLALVRFDARVNARVLG